MALSGSTKALLAGATASFAIEPLNWWLGRVLDRWAESPPTWLSQAARVQGMLDLPPYLFVGIGTGILIALVVLYMARPRSLVAEQATGPRRESIRRWRQAALAAQAEAEKIKKRTTHDVRRILEKMPEYYEFYNVYYPLFYKSRRYKRWKRRSRLRRLFGLRPPMSIIRNPDTTFIAGTGLSSHVYYMLKDIDELESWWRLD